MSTGNTISIFPRMSGLPHLNLCQALRYVTPGTSGFFSRAAIECGGGEGRNHERRSAGHYKDLTKNQSDQNRKLRMIFLGTQALR